MSAATPLSPAQKWLYQRVLAEGIVRLNGRVRRTVDALIAHGLVVADFDTVAQTKGNGVQLVQTIVVRRAPWTPPKVVAREIAAERMPGRRIFGVDYSDFGDGTYTVRMVGAQVIVSAATVRERQGRTDAQALRKRIEGMSTSDLVGEMRRCAGQSIAGDPEYRKALFLEAADRLEELR